MSKGESDWLLLPSSPKGEIVGIMIHMLYLMATHSSQMINYSAAKFTKFYAEKSLFHVEKIHALSWLVHGISPTVFDPMVLVRGIASKSVDLTHFHGWLMVLV